MKREIPLKHQAGVMIDIFIMIAVIYSLWHIDLLASYTYQLGILTQFKFLNGFFQINGIQGYHIAVYSIAIAVAYLVYQDITNRIDEVSRHARADLLEKQIDKEFTPDSEIVKKETEETEEQEDRERRAMIQ